MRPLLLALGVALTLAACRERLTVPGECPAQCPGGTLVIRDTVLHPLEAGDSAFFGYVGFNDLPGMMLTNSVPVGRSHVVVAFDTLPETFFFGGREVDFVIDSVEISLGVINRDSVVKAPRLILYRLPVDTDSTPSFEALDALFTAENLIDTIVVPDSVSIGRVTLMLRGDELQKLVGPPEDSGRVTFGIRLDADSLTGLRLGARLTDGFAPSLINHLTIDEPDTMVQRQFLAPGVRYAGVTRDVVPVTDPDLLVVGGLPAARSVIRFALPPAIAQAGSLMRATLTLTLARSVFGLRHDPTIVDVRAVVVDLGARSIPIPLGAAGFELAASGHEVIEIEVGPIVDVWRTQPLVPQMFYLSVTPEGQAFSEPVFFSTRSPMGKPTLRVTYTAPSRLETP